MLKTILIILFVIIILAAAGFFGFAYFISEDTGKPVSETLTEYFPFGVPDLGEIDVPFLGREDISDMPTLPEEGITIPEDNLPEIPRDAEPFQIKQLAVDPVGEAFATSTKSGQTIARYIDKQTGYVYEVNLEDGSKKQITNTTIPGIAESIWHNSGNSLIIRYLDEQDVIKSFYGRISVATGSAAALGSISGNFLPDDVRLLIPSPDRKNIFYFDVSGQNLIGTTANFDGTGKKEVFNTPFGSWSGAWVNAGTVALWPRPSYFADGFAGLLNLKTGVLDRVTENAKGISASVSPDLSYAIYTKGGRDNFVASVVNLKTRDVIPAGFSALPEKCVWSRKNSATVYCAIPQGIHTGTYPDWWYQGLVSFSDSIWRIDIARSAFDFLGRPGDSRGGVDAVNLVLDPEENYLFFNNKGDSSLWSIKLN